LKRNYFTDIASN